MKTSTRLSTSANQAEGAASAYPRPKVVDPKTGDSIDDTRREARRVHLGAGILGLAVLADSALEHYRGSFHNKAMFAPLVSATLSLSTNFAAAVGARLPQAALEPIQILAAATGLAGLGFHSYNIGKRPGVFRGSISSTPRRSARPSR